MKVAELEHAMAERGLIPADADPLPFGSAGRPWFVSLVLGVAGWLASLFGFLFALLLLEPDTAVEAGVLGTLVLGAGFGLYVADRENAFFEQLALALTLAGQLALLYAVGVATESAVAVSAVATAISAGLALTVPNRFAKTLSTLFACIAWAMTVRFGVWGEDWFDDRRETVALVPALAGWLVIWAPVAVATHVLIQREVRWMASGAHRLARPVLTGLLVALALGTWTSEPFAALTFWTPSTDMPVNWLVLWPLLGVAAALFAGLCAFRVRHHAMLGVAIAGALLHLVQFYYLLGVPLVVKAYVMVGVGVVLLLAARALRTGGHASVAPTPGGEVRP